MLEDAAERKDNRMNVNRNMETVDLYLSLGSNQGNREENIENALSLLNIELKTSYKALSSLIETHPWGFDSDNMFLNAAVHYELRLPKGYNPEAEGLMILACCKKVERMMGRAGKPEYDENGKRVYNDRPIDIDILLFGDNKIDTEELTVPHKLMYERNFVMEPLREIVGQAGNDVSPDLIGDMKDNIN